ncbi:MAG: MFS transporter, partial [Ktedonobacteraceae bacterium]
MPFLINRNFALLWLGQLISYTGDYVFETALVLWVATSIARGQQWAPMAVGGTFLAVTIPWLIIAPIAGVFVDRWHDKRRTMLWTNGLSLLLIAVLILATGVMPLPFIGSIQPPVILELAIIYGTSLLLAACAQFFSPAHLALIGDVVDAP